MTGVLGGYEYTVREALRDAILFRQLHRTGEDRDGQTGLYAAVAGHLGIDLGDVWSGKEPPAEPDTTDALDALRAVLEALNIPHAATAGGQEIRGKILVERAGHVVVMLESVLGARPDVPWAVGYLRDRLAEHPAAGYKTWAELTAELDAEREAGQ